MKYELIALAFAVLIIGGAYLAAAVVDASRYEACAHAGAHWEPGIFFRETSSCWLDGKRIFPWEHNHD